MTRRLPALVLTVAALVTLAVVARTVPERTEPVFSEPRSLWMPAVVLPSDDLRPTTWFCPGVPAEGEGRGGQVLVVNRSNRELNGRLTVLASAGRSTDRRVTIDPWASRSFDVTEDIDAEFVSAVVELDDVAALVEQRAVHPDGDAAAPCTTQVSSRWYLADGFTVGGSDNDLVLTNPYADDAVINLDIVTARGERSPVEYQGFPVPGRSVRVIDLASVGARNEELLAATVSVRGRLVVGRSQHFTGGGRRGYTMTLAAPAPSDQWWFAIGDHGEGVDEQYRVYNPTEERIEVTAVPLGVTSPDAGGDAGGEAGSRPDDDAGPDDDDGEEGGDDHDHDDDVPEGVFAGQLTLEVAPGAVEVVEAADIEGLPDGPHSMVFGTATDDGEIVVERVLTRTVGGQATTTVSLGLPRRLDGDVPQEWYIPRAPAGATEDALTVYNVDASAPAAIAVYRITDDGFVLVPGLDDLSVGASNVRTIDLTHRSVHGQPLVVTSSGRIVLERSIPRDGPLGGFNVAWGVPRE